MVWHPEIKHLAKSSRNFPFFHPKRNNLSEHLDFNAKYCIMPSSDDKIECFFKYLMEAETWQQ